jgi:hypothetical protein
VTGEKTIAIVCNKLPADQDRAEPVLDLLKDSDAAQTILCLPLLGRLSGTCRRFGAPGLANKRRKPPLAHSVTG